jgi:rubrerythrin
MQESGMNIFDFALEREQDSEAYYRQLAEKAPDAGLRNILTRLADSEVTHANVIRHMKDNVDFEWKDDSFLTDVRSSFTDIRDRGPAFDFDMAQVDVYKKAQGFEKETMELYRKGAREAGSEKGKQLMLRLAGQEKMHFQILGSIIEVVSRPLPGNWLEDAEWYHLEEY